MVCRNRAIARLDGALTVWSRESLRYPQGAALVDGDVLLASLQVHHALHQVCVNDDTRMAAFGVARALAFLALSRTNEAGDSDASTTGFLAD